MTKARIIPVFIPHLGCPRDCVFCNQRAIAAPKEPSPEAVAGLIEAGLRRSGPGAELAFYGGSFTAIQRDKRMAYLRAAEPFVRDGRLCGVRVSTRPDCISEEILAELRQMGVRRIELGAQSCDERVLALAGRGHTFADTVLASRLILRHGFALVLQMMIGLPGESDETPMQNAVALASLGPEAVRIYPVVVLRDTALERLWRAGLYEPLTPERAAELAAGPLRYFEERGIRVIRIGLNPTEDLSGGEAVAGAYHPALGELTRSAVFLEEMRNVLRSSKITGGAVTLLVPPGRRSAATGQHRKNIELLQQEFSIRKLRVLESGALSGFHVSLPGEPEAKEPSESESKRCT